MILRTLTLAQYGPFREPVCLELGPTGRPGERPICLVGALNGSGKTSVLDALLLALYGPRARLSTRGDRSWRDFLASARNSHATPGERSVVSLSFDYPTAAGTTGYRLVRSWWPADGVLHEGLEVWTRDEPGGEERLDPDLTQTWAERVEELVPLGVSNLFFFDGELVGRLAAQDEPPAEVHEAIHTLLGLELPARLSRDLDIVTTRRRKALGGAPELADVQALERALHTVEEERGQRATEAGEARALLVQAQRAHEEERQRFLAAGGTLAERRAQIEQAQGQARAQVQAHRGRLAELASGPLPLALVAPLLRRTLTRARAELRHLDSQDLGATLEERDGELLSTLRGLGLDAKRVRMVEAWMARDRGERAVPLQGGPPYLGLGRSAVAQAEALLHTQLPEQQATARHTAQALEAAQAELERLQGQLSAAAPPEALGGLLAGLERAGARVRAQEERLQQLSAEHRALELRAEQLRRELEQRLQRLAQEHQDNQSTHRVLGAAARVQQVLAAYAARLKQKKLGQLEELITERFATLARKDGQVQRVELHPETFRLSLFGAGHRPIDKARLSAGEQQLLALAFLWALSVASGRKLPVVIDTPLGRMDSAHRRRLVERYFPNASHQVVLLSTDEEINEAHHRRLVALGALDRSILLEFDPAAHSTRVRPGTFWE